uniref:Myb-like domain-containing protein n=1 Tax=Kalanchoe fedtschenkoi TaxID=63787 RepID=A0A7N0RBP6_KALFE
MALSLAVDGGDADGVAAVAAEETAKAPRLPRWTRQEILVLIQGKRVVETRVRRGRASGLTFGPGQVEPKWASVSSYCKRHGVNRGAVQCRKRWSNLAGDYKKIKEWESQTKEETESFWVMRNDLRREKKLPGFFDREVYDILEGDSPATCLALALGPALQADADDAEAVFDSGRTTAAAAAQDGLFSDEDDGNETPLSKESPPTRVAAPLPISEKVYQPYSSSAQDARNEKEPAGHQEGGSSSQDARKRRRYTVEDGDVEPTLSLQDKLIRVLERNGEMLRSQLQAQNNNLQLDREQRKDNAASVVGVLNKLADALVKIAEKL